jgi:hypothetical protein
MIIFHYAVTSGKLKQLEIKRSKISTIILVQPLQTFGLYLIKYIFWPETCKKINNYL